MAVLDFFLSPAFAADAAPAAASSSSFFIMTAALILMMYLMVWRPQSRRAREMRDLTNALAKGDEVMTASGLLGTITTLKQDYIHVKLAEGVEVVMQRSSVASLLPKGTLKSI